MEEISLSQAMELKPWIYRDDRKRIISWATRRKLPPETEIRICISNGRYVVRAETEDGRACISKTITEQNFPATRFFRVTLADAFGVIEVQGW